MSKVKNLDTKSLDTNEIQKLVTSLNSELKNRENKERRQLRTEFDKKLKAYSLTISDLYPELSSRPATAAAGEKGKKRGRPVGSPNRKRRTDRGQPVAAKYQHPKSGETWTGRGKPKKWVMDELKNKNLTLEQFKQKKDYQAA